LDAEELLRIVATKKMDELDSLPEIKEFPEFEKMRKNLISSVKSGDMKSLVGSLEDITKILSGIVEEKK